MRHTKRLTLAALSVAFSLTLFFMTGEDTFSACGAMVGCAFGILSERKFIRFTMPDKWWKGVLRVLLGLAVINILAKISAEKHSYLTRSKFFSCFGNTTTGNRICIKIITSR